MWINLWPIGNCALHYSTIGEAQSVSFTLSVYNNTIQLFCDISYYGANPKHKIMCLEFVFADLTYEPYYVYERVSEA